MEKVQFGDYINVAQKRFGSDNEIYLQRKINGVVRKKSLNSKEII